MDSKVIYVAETCPSDDPFDLFRPARHVCADQKGIHQTLHAACCWVAVALWPRWPTRDPNGSFVRNVWSYNPEDMVVRVNFPADSHGGSDLLASFNPDALTRAIRATQSAYGGEERRFVVQRPALTLSPRKCDGALGSNSQDPGAAREITCTGSVTE